ncbi:hypothetical protein QZH41_018999 [Actinostola sp. cb2023]|nr:hypothetical protein QZH41_018999 [Actinostola sp. cb2023]
MKFLILSLQILFILCLVHIFKSSFCDFFSCGSQLKPPRCRNLKRLHKKYTVMFVDMNPSITPAQLQPPRLPSHTRTKRDNHSEHAVQGRCPWVWVEDSNPSRFTNNDPAS